jgi:hypothetical protein
MRDFFQFLNNHQEMIAAVTTLLATVATVSSKSLAALLTSRELAHQRQSSAILINGKYVGSVKIRDGVPSSHSLARAQVVRRLDDAKTARTKERTTASVSRFLAGSLTFAQVVIGGVLASSFVQESLSQKTVGVFGVLVLIASLVKQQYRPEVDAQQAREKVSKLEALIRFSEDEIATLDARSATGQDRTDAFIELTHKLSLLLTAIENPEALPALKERALEDVTVTPAQPNGSTAITPSDGHS